MKHDEVMDRLLERASRPPGDTRPEGCLDAEVLAAWSEGSLTPVERAVAEAHAADCDRCLAVLAALAKTAPPAHTAAESWFSLRWMLPLGAAAAVVLAVVLVQDSPEVPPPAPAPVAPAPTATPVAPPPSPASVGARDQFTKAAPASPERKTKQTPAATPDARERAARREGEAAAKQLARPQNQTIDSVLAPPAAPAAGAGAAPAPARMLEFRQTMAALAEIASTDPAVRWRIAGASVARSTDAGQSWVTQTTGTEAPLLAGSAPSASVCWIVGRTGTVLLTTDAATWQRLEFPDPTADLVAVTARDARSATVTTATGRTYRTDDGGRTWVLQESLTAPFYQ